MAQSAMQHSFNSGEWAPALNARVDITKYHNGAAVLRNFFVDYRGGATARAGTKFISKTFTNLNTRLIPFQASFSVAYLLEFGEKYVRFFNNGAPVLEPAGPVTAATRANPCVITAPLEIWNVGDWIVINNVVGMTQLNGNTYIVAAVNHGSHTVTLNDINGNPVNSTAFGTYVSGGTAARVLTLVSPYTAVELSQLKFVQNVNFLIINHPNLLPYSLQLQTSFSWVLAAITFGSTIAAPGTPTVSTTLGAGTVNYAYVVTSVDANGQESAASSFGTLASILDIRTSAGTITVSWSAVAGAQSYNVYRAQPNYAGIPPAGSAFGFIGNIIGTSFADSNIAPNFGLGPPVILTPFAGTGLQTVTVTSGSSFAQNTAVPAVGFSGGGATTVAQGTANYQLLSISLGNGGTGFAVYDTINLANGVVIVVLSVTGGGVISTFAILNNGLLSSTGDGVFTTAGTFPPNPVNQVLTSGVGIGSVWNNLTWTLASITITVPGIGYTSNPTVIFPSGAATATATRGGNSAGNPTVPALFQQRLVLAGQSASPEQFNMSQTGAIFNFNINAPIEASDAIQGTIVANQLSTIQSMIPQPYGLIVLSDKGAWLMNGGGNGVPVSPSSITANAEIYNGANSLPPIVAGDTILYVQAKGSIVRNLIFNYYTQIYTGTDISVLSSHLFYGFQILEWAWAEEPFKIIWAVRNNGTLLSLTFLKEQELTAWAHSDTPAGFFRSIATVTETVSLGAVDAIYTIVQRVINGAVVQFIERMAELYYPIGLTDAWCVDAGLQYNGASALTFSGALHLIGATVTGLATDNLGNVTVIAPFVIGATGSFTLAAPAGSATGYTRVTVGIAYLPQLQTLAIDLTSGDTVQGKRKKITGVTARVKDALGLSIGGTFSTLIPMKDLVIGNVGSASNTIVTGLVTTDARQVIESNWTVPGQYCFQQNNPFPCSILGVIPEITVGDGPK